MVEAEHEQRVSIGQDPVVDRLAEPRLVDALTVPVAGAMLLLMLVLPFAVVLFGSSLLAPWGAALVAILTAGGILGFSTLAGSRPEMRITFGEQTLVYRKRAWKIPDEKSGELIEKGLRYGENPDQQAALFELVQGNLTLGGCEYISPGNGLVSSITEADMIQAGKHPGKTNLTDLDNGLNVMKYLMGKPAAVILKHNNPCGAAYGGDIAEAYGKANMADRIAAFGGCLVVNRAMDRKTAEMVSENYLEVVAAPEFEEGSIGILAKRKNLRIIRVRRIDELEKYRDLRIVEFKALTDGGITLEDVELANPLTADYDVPHGQAVGMMLPHVIRFNAEAVGHWYKDLLAMCVVVDAAGTGEAGASLERLVLERGVVLLDDGGSFGSRSHDGHLAAQHVEELGELVDFRAPQQMPERKHARILLRRDHALSRIVTHVHGAQLVHREARAVAADAFGPVQDRTGTRQANADRGKQQHGRQDDERQRRDHDINQAACHGASGGRS